MLLTQLCYTYIVTKKKKHFAGSCAPTGLESCNFFSIALVAQWIEHSLPAPNRFLSQISLICPKMQAIKIETTFPSG